MHSLESISQTDTGKPEKNSLKESTKKNIAYDKELIGLLKNDHDEIVNLYSKILHSTINEEYINVEFLLIEFATSFTDHIQVEDEKLYGYLKLLASNKSHLEQKIVAKFSFEMKKISISISAFLTQSPFIPVDDLNKNEFIKEFEKIGLLLQDRIIREEKVLYPIYKNNET